MLSTEPGAGQVSQERTSFFLPMSEAQAKTIPLMPDQDYKWLSDDGWRTRNDALFARSSEAAREKPRR
jgi:hypothetical protein